MNASYNKKYDFDSNNRIYEGYFTEVKKEKSKLAKLLSSLLACLFGVWQLLSQVGVRRVVKVAMIPLLVIGFLGVACSVESGAIGFGLGLLLLALLLVAEFLCLRTKRSARSEAQ